MQQIVIYGAKSIALGVCLAVRKLYSNYPVIGFAVKSLQNNPHTLAGLQVWELKDLKKYTDQQPCILISTPEDTHKEIMQDLEHYGFWHYICIDSRKEAKLMEKYFSRIGQFASIHKYRKNNILNKNVLKESSQKMQKMIVKPKICIYMARYYKDRKLRNAYNLPKWIHSVSAGASLSTENLQKIRDDTGDSISKKNGNYCELTVLYWIWKNRLQNYSKHSDKADYYGLYHYRRILDLDGDDILQLQEKDIDVVLPYPTIHEPDIYEHHTRYLNESDWRAMSNALEELHPEYAKVYPEILSQPYFYNYNILVAKSSVLEAYCAWLFPVLELTEQMSRPRGWERSDRYIGYLGENLLTLYFMYHSQDLNIAHTGRHMLI